jgi:hypothetical protein
MTKMMQDITEQLLVETVRQGMDQSVRDLDWQTQAKLTRLRLQAMEQKSHLSEHFGFSSFSRGFAVATAVTLAATLWVLPDVTETPPGVLPVPSDNLTDASDSDLDMNVMEVLMSSEDMDLLENLEMYEWLEAEYG